MKAKDTVIKKKDCKYQPDGSNDELWADLGAVYQDVYLEGCKAQAEISFKSGHNEGYKKGRQDSSSNQYAGMSNNEIFGHPG